MKDPDDYLDGIDDIIQDIKDENLFDEKPDADLQSNKSSTPDIKTPSKNSLFSRSLLKQKLIQAFYPPFIHAGISDAITTVIALNLGFSELNPLVSMLFPSQIIFIPAILVAFAYGRALSAVLLFKSKKYLKPMLWLTLYFPAIFNTVNIVLFYFHKQIS